MRNTKSVRKVLCILLLAIFALSLVATSPVLAYLYRATFTVSNNGSANHTALPASCSADVDWLIDNGFVTTATALDTRVETLGGVEQLHMMASDRIMAFAPSLDGNSQLNWYLTTGNTELDNFPVIVGSGGYFDITDHADLELANNFSIEFDGWLDLALNVAPTVEGTDTSEEAAETTTHDVSLPSGIVEGDLLLMLFSCYSDFAGSPQITVPGGWTALDQEDLGTYGDTLVAYRIATGGEGLVVEVTTDDSVSSAHQTFRISGYFGVPELTLNSDVSNAAPDPPSLTPSWGDEGETLWLALFLGGRSTDITVAAYPANYDNGQLAKGAGDWNAYVGSARRELKASSENPGTFTLSDTMTYCVGTLAVRDPARLIYKAAAFSLEVDDEDLVAEILGGSALNLTVSGLDSGEYLVRVWADTTNFGIDLDGVTENSTALGGSSVPSNANDYSVSIPYFNCFNLTVNDNHRIRYEPDSLIEGTTLLNEESPGTHDGMITWGSNPSGVSVTLGSLVAPESTVTTEEEEGGYQGAMREVEVTDWFLEPDIGTKLAVHPLRPLITIWSDNSTVTEVQAWRFMGLALLLLITVVAAVMVRGHLLIAGLACGGTIALLVQQTVWPGWTLVFIIPAIVAGVMAERTPSIG